MDSPEKSRAAVYAQERRDNEAQARDELLNRLSKLGFSRNDIEARGDFNQTTKALAAALVFLNPTAWLPVQEHDVPYSTKSAEYNATRRTNEATVREDVRRLIPDRILEKDWMRVSNFNQTTKVVVAITMHIDGLQQAKASTQPAEAKNTSFVKSRRSSGYDGMDIDDDDTSEMKNSTRTIEHTTSQAIQKSLLQTSMPTPDKPTPSSSKSSLPKSYRFSTKPQQSSSISTNHDTYTHRPPVRGTFQLDLKPPPRPENLKSIGPTSTFHPNAATPSRFRQIPIDRREEMPFVSKPVNNSAAKKHIKNNGAQEPWHNTTTKTAWCEEPAEYHPLTEARDLEQVAKRLVAKTKELLEPVEEPTIDQETGEQKRIIKTGYLARKDGVSELERKDLEWVHDLLVDACAVIERSSERKRIVKKWEGKKRGWEAAGLTADN